MTHVRSSLARYQPHHPATRDDLHRMAKAAWHRQGVLLVRPETITCEWLRAELERIGNSLYGERTDR